MMLLRIYFDDGTWWAEWLTGCDITLQMISFAEALMLELLL